MPAQGWLRPVGTNEPTGCFDKQRLLRTFVRPVCCFFGCLLLVGAISLPNASSLKLARCRKFELRSVDFAQSHPVNQLPNPCGNTSGWWAAAYRRRVRNCIKMQYYGAMKKLTLSQWTAQCARRLGERWRAARVPELEGAAVEVGRDAEFRQLQSEEAATHWLSPLQERASSR